MMISTVDITFVSMSMVLMSEFINHDPQALTGFTDQVSVPETDDAMQRHFTHQ